MKFDFLLCFSGGSDFNGEEESPIPRERQEENERTRNKMKMIKEQMENLSLMKEKRVNCVISNLFIKIFGFLFSIKNSKYRYGAEIITGKETKVHFITVSNSLGAKVMNIQY